MKRHTDISTSLPGPIFPVEARIRPGRSRPRPRMQAWLDALALLLVALALASVLLEFGFYRLPGPLSLPLLHAVQTVTAVLMLLDRAARALLAEQRLRYLRRTWPECLTVVAAVLVGLALPGRPAWLTAVRVYLLLATLVYAVRLYMRAVDADIDPPRLLAGSFGFLALLGTGLLLLPRAVPEGGRPLYISDAMFTATSACCVTGLTVLDTGSEFSRLGQWVILGLIQVGGLGIMISGTILVMLGGRLGLRHTALMGEAMAEQTLGHIRRTVRFVVISTLLIELVGAALLRPLWGGGSYATFAALFHSVAAFCNAGFALQKDNLISLRGSWQVMLVIPLLIIFGGMGFPVMLEVVRSLLPAAWRTGRQLLHTRRVGPAHRWTLHSRIALVTTGALLVIGPIGILALNPASVRLSVGQAYHDPAGSAAQGLTDWQRMSLPQRIGNAWFQSVTARTAGFNTMDLNDFSPGGKLWMIMLMVIGGSPASTAGGIKTVTFAVLITVTWSMLRRRGQVEAFGRTLTPGLVNRALTLTLLYGGLLAGATMALSVAQGPTSRFIDILFEVASACGTVGLSLGETGRLTEPGKFIIIIAMFAGRVGPLTLLMSLTAGHPPARYSYPSENLVVG